VGDAASHSPSCLFLGYWCSPVFVSFPKLIAFQCIHFLCVGWQSGSTKTSAVAPTSVFCGRTRANKELVTPAQCLGCRNGFPPVTVTWLRSEEGDTPALCWPQPRSGSGMLVLDACAVVMSCSSAGALGLGTCSTRAMLPEEHHGGPCRCCRFGQFIEKMIL